MTTPLKADIEESVRRIEDALLHDRHRINGQYAFGLLQTSLTILRTLYPSLYGSMTTRGSADYADLHTAVTSRVQIEMMDEADADGAAFRSATGTGGLHNGGVALYGGQQFQLRNVADFADDALATAKGAALAAGDIFTAASDGAVTFIGTGTL